MDFSQSIVYWYLQNNRQLPWRTTKTPYHIWLSEIMLQQTRVAQGLPYFLKFTHTFPTIFDLAKAKETKVLKLWQGLGYYSRARNLHHTAKYIANELNGKFPENYTNLLQLKGVGDYTASAIASICFNEPKAVVDGNVYRVLTRYFGIETPVNSSAGIKEIKELAQMLIDPTQPGTYNQAIMDFGALHCKPQNPLCDECVLAESCIALSKKWTKRLPVKEKKQKIKNRYFNYLVVITPDKKTLFEERTAKDIWQKMYQFPLIETQKTIDKQQLTSFEDFKTLFPVETNISLFNKKNIVHKLSHQHLHTKFWIIKTAKVNHKTICWETVKNYPIPVLIDNFLNNFITDNN